MARWTSFAPLAALLLALGCASPYVIYLRSGETLYSTDEPDYDKDAGFYVFQDETGREQRVNKDDIERMERR
jgi:hypothetical protein